MSEYPDISRVALYFFCVGSVLTGHYKSTRCIILLVVDMVLHSLLSLEPVEMVEWYFGYEIGSGVWV